MTDQWPTMVVSSDLENRRSIARVLSAQGFDPFSVGTVKECREVLNEREVAVIFCDRDLSDGDYRDILASVMCAPQKKRARVVLMSLLMKPEEYQEAKRSGVFDIIGLPCRPTNIEWAIILAKRDERNRAKQLIGVAPLSPSRGKSAVAGVS